VYRSTSGRSPAGGMTPPAGPQVPRSNGGGGEASPSRNGDDKAYIQRMQSDLERKSKEIQDLLEKVRKSPAAS
jgi:hypothetical protein